MSEAQDAVNFVEECLKEAFEKYKVDSCQRVYNIFEVEKASEGFVVKLK